jgi:hypothetical protein
VDNVLSYLGYSNYNLGDFSTPDTLTMFILSTIYGCIIAPITEELLFRGFVLRAFSVVSQKTGIFVSAFIFALIHNNIAQFLLAFPMGLLLGYVAFKYGSLIPCMLIHCAVNTMATILSDILPKTLNEDGYNTVVSFIVILEIIFAIVAWFGISLKDNMPLKTKLQSGRNLVSASFFFAVFIGLNVYETLKIMFNF